MTALPNRNILDGTKLPATTTSEMKTALGSLRDFISESLGVDSTQQTLVNPTLSNLNGGQLAGLRNRIINGDMRIDQRNAGAAVTSSIVTGYLLDRYQYVFGATSKITAQQVADAPAGFKYSTKLTVASQYAAGNAEEFCYRQTIEGQNLIDFQFGLATAQQFTFSAWVKASVAGNYSVFLTNVSGARCYVSTVPVTNSWTRQSITVTADTLGTWDTGNLVGLYLGFDLGSGASFNGTPGSWQTTSIRRATSSVAFVNTAAATFNTTGWQLELGSVATPFEQRPIGLEELLCKRYWRLNDDSLFGVWDFSTTTAFLATTSGYSSMRATPTPSIFGTGINAITRPGIANHNITAVSISNHALNITTTATSGGVVGILAAKTIALNAEL